MITARVRLSHFGKVLITESGARQSSDWKTLLGVDKLITKYFESKF